MKQGDVELLLEKHYNSIEKIILLRQDAITGLLPASTAINAHGDYTDAWVRDNVYSIMSVWGLSLAYKKHKPKDVKAYTLKQSVVKLMRGLLNAMMHQSQKLEEYKKSRDPLDALHAKYATDTGLAVVGDDEWGHLQLDATSLYLLMLSEMSASGISIIYTLDEVDFVQNLVHYISRTYATPDYGIWERGNKINHGSVEINCSSVGMAKAALEAMDGCNLFSENESKEGVIYVMANDIARSRLTLKGLLPRESDSKETDAALLSIIGYPAYSVEDAELVEKTREKILKKLGGNYGCKRFLLDGHQSTLEDASRLHYEPSELRQFANIESEWPLFYTYLLLDALIREDREAVELYKAKLEPLFIEKDGQRLLPELYYVKEEDIEKEKTQPSSQKRQANENLPLVWAQSLYMLSEMLDESLLESKDIDPFSRRESVGKSLLTTPYTTIISENSHVKGVLEELDIASQTLEELAPLEVSHASELSKLYASLGKNEKLGLTGREILTPRTISTSKIYLINSKERLFLPHYFDPKAFYLGFDNKLLVEYFRSSLHFLASSWNKSRSPVVPFFVREEMLQNHSKDEVIHLLKELKHRRLSSLKESVEREEITIEDEIIFESVHPCKRESQSDAYELAAREHRWCEARSIAQSNGIFDERLEDALLDIVTARKRVGVGRAYSDASIISEPEDAASVMQKIQNYCGDNESEEALTQEIILHIGHLLRMEPELFANMLTIRTWDAIQLLVGHISKQRACSMGDAYEEILSFAPHGIYETLRLIYHSYTEELLTLKELENLHISGGSELKRDFKTSEESNNVEDWALFREKMGRIGVSSEHFYKDVWYILQQCQGLVIGDKYSIKSRIGSEWTLESTPRERSFELKVDALLQEISAPEYRKLNIELIETLAKLLRANTTLMIEDDLVLDVLIGHAVRISWMNNNSQTAYEEYKGEAWHAFYRLSMSEVQTYFIEAFSFLIQEEI